MEYINTLDFARQQDQADPLRKFRSQFYFPIVNGKQAIYFTGNSLGLQPRSVQDHVLRELEDWATYGVEGHFHAHIPWYHYKEHLKGSVSRLLGASEDEVVVMNSLTVNLHLLLVSFYRPRPERYKLICEYDAFPSDLYALQSQAHFHGYDPDDAIIYLKPREGEYCLRHEDVLRAIDEAGDTLATVMLGAVNYYTGQFFDLGAIAERAHRAGATCGFNLAHATGNVPLQLHDWDVDFACFCSYKYLNAGPGGVSGVFVHERHLREDLPRFAGWWGNDPDSRFRIPRQFVPVPAASAWALSNDPVLPMAALKASLDIFDEAGMEALRRKSELLTGYAEYVIDEVNRRRHAGPEHAIRIITPSEPRERGCQLSLVVPDNGKEVFGQLTAKGVISDWRDPDVIRIAPVALYNTFEDVFLFGDILAGILAE